jgi:6-phospho-beta-glucosidase
LLRQYADRSLTHKPASLSSRGGAFYSEAAVALLASLFTPGQEARHVVNLRNQGRFTFLADDAVIEAAANVSSSGFALSALPPLDPLFRGLVSHVSAYEELALEAACYGGQERVFRALLAHPLIGQTDVADALSRKMIEVNQGFLPWA